MTITAAPTRTAPRHVTERTPNPVLSVVFCLAVFAGGLFGAQQWLTGVCPTTPELGGVCEVMNVPA